MSSPAPAIVVAPSALRARPVERAALVRRARLLAWVGIAWHGVEAAVAIAAGLAAASIALVGFGVDSLIESLAGFVLIWRFSASRSGAEAAEERAQKLIGATFFLLALYVAVEAARTLVAGTEPAVSWIGLALAAVTAVTMPLLAAAKRRVGRRLASSATVSEGAQNMLCAYLSAALLAGLGANALLGWWWADPAAALVVAAVAAYEGVRSWRGDACCDAC